MQMQLEERSKVHYHRQKLSTKPAAKPEIPLRNERPRLEILVGEFCPHQAEESTTCKQ